MGVSLPPFQLLLDSQHEHVRRFLLAAVGPHDADDCVQETFLAALRAYPRLSHRDNLRAWLFRIAQRKALDAHRARARRPVPVAAPPEPEAAATHDGSAADALAAVRRLPSKQRAAVLLRHLIGAPYAEIAEVLGCSQEAARRSVHDGLSNLRREFRDDRVEA